MVTELSFHVKVRSKSQTWSKDVKFKNIFFFKIKTHFSGSVLSQESNDVLVLYTYIYQYQKYKLRRPSNPVITGIGVKN